MPETSIWDSSYDLDNESAVVSVVYKGLHSMLMIEKVSPRGEYEVHVADFMPLSVLHRENRNSSSIVNSTPTRSARSTMRSMTVSTVSLFKEVEAGVVNLETAPVRMPVVKDEVIRSFELNGRSIPYKISRDQANTLLRHVRRQFQKEVPIARFQVRGTYTNDNTEGEVHNCETWVRVQLKLIGIEIIPSLMDKTSTATPRASTTVDIVNSTPGSSCVML